VQPKFTKLIAHDVDKTCGNIAKKYREQDLEETRLEGSESAAGVPRCTQCIPTPVLYRGWLPLSCEG